jgi:carbon monoxide dehydrogenase subunit G
MSITLKRAFEVGRPVDDVWLFLTNPHRIAECMPGAHLREIHDEKFTGEVSLRLGPFGTTLRGLAGFQEMDRESHCVLMAADAREIEGTGRAEVRMRSRLQPVNDSATHVDVRVGVRLSGRLDGPLLRRVMAGAAEIVFRRFVGCVRDRLEERAAGDRETSS